MNRGGILATVVLLWSLPACLFAQNDVPVESDYYTIQPLNIPGSIVLEAAGLSFNDEGQLAVTTRRGEVWLISEPASEEPVFQRFAEGLHEPLGIAWRDGVWYVVQRGEITKLEDRNGDGKADHYETIYRWPLTGNYHEYSYGPYFLPDGDMLVNLNLSWIGYGESLTDWRGWMLKISTEGEMTPYATGLRSPVGFGQNEDGDIFYTENQGDWVASGWMTHLESGDFAGNPAGLRWTNRPESPLDLRPEEIDDSQGLTLYEQAQNIPELKPPAVWFPHAIMGISTSGILLIENDEQMGPFAGQFLVGDQGHSKIMRVFLETVQGEYQGAAFEFREGFPSGVVKLEWGPNDEVYVGMTNRGWGSTGPQSFGLERMKWNGTLPFEMQKIEAESNGFTITFTKPVDPRSAMDLNSYRITDFTYRYHSSYGSPVINRQEKTVTGLEVADDRLSVRLYVDGLREGFIQEIRVQGVHSNIGTSLLHPVGYYTLNQLPDGERSALAAGTGVVGSEDRVGEPSGKNVTERPESWREGADVTIQLSTEPGLRYDKDLITVSAGSRIALTFRNADDMIHNVVIVEPGTADKVGEAAMNLGLDAAALEYVPRMDEVIYHTSLMQPGQVQTIYLEAPETPGDYIFVCTFPGHHISMRGILRVE
ncbi:MAG: plastocyanin/azurin family copper-binding protein [Balneolaceae bacterium]